jgi:hypothetical protein
MSNDRHADFVAGMRQKEKPLNSTGLKGEPRNNRKDWSGWDNPSQPSKKKVVDQVLPVVDLGQLAEKDWLGQL